MFPLPGFSDFVFILLVVLIIFGAGKLAYLANLIGRAALGLRRRLSSSPPDEEE